jgi:DNA polymerase-3 subunit gamma/tau
VQQFIVSARKYRPSTFADVVGQKHVAETLMHEITGNKLAQAFLFTGPRGVGKTTCARILAKVINIQDENIDPNQDFAFNIFELDAASNNSVDDIRHLIDQVRIPPQVGKYKVYIIDEVHMLSTAAFNAFLKTLEEPPSYAIFILATTEKHKILPTILSRCQVFNFNRIEASDMVEHLKMIAQSENIVASDDALHLIARKADGGLRDALSLFDQLVSFSRGDVTYEKAVEILNILDVDTFFDVTEALIHQNISEALLIFDNVLNKGFDGSLFISGMAQHFRNLMVCKDESTLRLLDVSQAFKLKYLEQTKMLDLGLIINALNLTNETDEKYKFSRNPRLLIELMLIKLSHLAQFISEIPTLEDIKKKLANPSFSSPQKTTANTVVSTDRAVPTIKEHIEEKITSTRLGKLDRNTFKQKKLEKEISAQVDSNSKIQNLDSKPSEEVAILMNADVIIPSIHQMMEEFSLSQSSRVSGLIKSILFHLEGQQVVFTVSSKAQELAMEDIRIPMLQFLIKKSRSTINNVLVVMGAVEETAKRPYTDKEKLDYFLKKHKDLSTVIEKLHLRLI